MALVLAACASTPVASQPPAATLTPVAVETAAATAPGSPPIDVTGSQKTGVSGRFKLAAGSYAVAWSATANEAGCAFYLFLTTKKDGPTIKDVPIQILVEKKTYDGTTEWTGVKAGTYVMQQDRSGTLNCTGLWSATLTRH